MIKHVNAHGFMASMRASLKKEWLEAVATHRLLIIALAFLFFSLLDPLMLKIMPLLLKNQLKGIDLSALFTASQLSAVQSFIGDLQEIVQFVLILTLMGIVSQERLEKRLVIPVSMGLDLRAAYLAKWLLYSLALTLIVPVAIYIANLYGGLLFGFEQMPGPTLLERSIAVTLYFVGVLSLLMMCSARFKRPLTAGFMSLFAVYGLSAIMGIWESAKLWFPQTLIGYATNGLEGGAYPWESAVTVLIVIGLSFVSLLMRKDYVAKSI